MIEQTSWNPVTLPVSISGWEYECCGRRLPVGDDVSLGLCFRTDPLGKQSPEALIEAELEVLGRIDSHPPAPEWNVVRIGEESWPGSTRRTSQPARTGFVAS